MGLSPFRLAVAGVAAAALIAGVAFLATHEPASPEAALEQTLTTDHFEGRYSIEGVPATSGLARRLAEDAARALTTQSEEAALDAASMTANGFEPSLWSHTEAWRVLAGAGGYLSVVGMFSTFTGGAHPNHGVEAGLYTPDGEPVDASTFFTDFDAARPALMVALCETVAARKTERTGEASVFGEPLVCDEGGQDLVWTSADMTFAASTEAGAFGGLIAYYEPYMLGPYAEGVYVVTLDQSLFRDAQTETAKPLFAGRAVGDDTWN